MSLLWCHASSRMAHSAPERRPQPSFRPANAARLPLQPCIAPALAPAHAYYGPSGSRILESPRLHGARPLGSMQPFNAVPLPTGRGTSWPDFEASREVRSRSHSSSSGLTAPIGPSLMRARVPVCAHRCDQAQRRRPSDVGSIATSPEIAATVSAAAFELSGDRRDRQSEVRRACHFSNPTAGAAMLTAVSVRARHYACHGALIASRVCRLSLIPARLERVRRRSGLGRSPRASPMTTLPAPRHERAMAVRAPAGRRTRPTHGRSESHRAG